MLKIFQDVEGRSQQAEFVAWLQANPQGYVVHDRGRGGLMIHRATCDHFQPHDEWAKTTTPKVCSPDKRALEDWARGRDETLLTCEHCM